MRMCANCTRFGDCLRYASIDEEDEEERRGIKRKHKMWIHDIFKKRSQFGEYHALFTDLLNGDVLVFHPRAVFRYRPTQPGRKTSSSPTLSPLRVTRRDACQCDAQPRRGTQKRQPRTGFERTFRGLL
ncbi:Hypothetical protein CINCED_3A013302 [Cinara cedri]|uniref:Uncharacterized protein n=1 Tax=Cinara cedri TaxID=506608 RepID=A0A5E4MNP9_9HEMI|nr:Hypothetical protein CINCED_3A013302 [Cinara cedri]